MFKPFASKNLLEEWRKEAFVLSSPLVIRSEYERSRVEYIYQTLLDFFGSSFFMVKGGTDKTIDKISWLFGLLSTNRSIPCYHALYDVCLLIAYSKTLEGSIQKELQQLKRNPENLRTFFFELFIYRLLDLNNIANAKKVVSGNQVLEGTCELAGRTFLFECRKAFLPKIHELDVMRRILTDIWLMSRKYPVGIGMICTIKLNRPIVRAHHSDMREKLSGFFKKLSEIKARVSIQYKHAGDYGVFSAIDYDEATLIEIKATKDFDVLYYVVPPKMPVRGIPDHYQAKIACNFSVSQLQIIKKLESLLKEKKKQHRGSTFQNKIIFLDSESLPEFHMNIFQNGGMYDLEMIRQAYNKVGLKDILCIVRRFYGNAGPFVLVDVIAPPHLEDAAEKLQAMLLTHHADLKKSSLQQTKIITR